MSHLKPGKPTGGGVKPMSEIERRQLNCDHEDAEDIELMEDGLMTGVCTNCEAEIVAEEIDTKWLEDSGEIVVLEWREW